MRCEILFKKWQSFLLQLGMLFCQVGKVVVNPKILTRFVGLECFLNYSVDLGNWSFNFGGFNPNFLTRFM